MITNPEIGMKALCNGGWYAQQYGLLNKVGTIVGLGLIYPIIVEIDNHRWPFLNEELDPVSLTDLERRQEHANKYL